MIKPRFFLFSQRTRLTGGQGQSEQKVEFRYKRRPRISKGIIKCNRKDHLKNSIVLRFRQKGVEYTYQLNAT